MTIFGLRLSSVLGIAALLLLSTFSVAANPLPSPAISPIDAAVWQEVAEHGEARVIMMLDERLAPSTLSEAQRVRELQSTLLARLPQNGFRVVRRYEVLPALAGFLSAEGLAALEGNPLLAKLQLDAEGGGHLEQSVPAIQAERVWTDFGVTGEGVTVAVLDTGVDTDHSDLADDIVAQRCFTDGACKPDNSNQGWIAEDEHGHGTNVTGVITARGIVSSKGFAPDAGIIAIRVLDAHNWGWLSDWVAGLDWLIANQDSLQVDVVNMSLGTYALYTGNCDNQWPIMEQALTRLDELGVLVFSSTGNKGAANAMGSPACNNRAVAVGATYDGNLGRQPISGTYRNWYGSSWPDCYDADASLHVITCFTNSGPMLDIVAPGARITAPGIGGGLSTYVGTSQASPTAAAIAALMLEADPTLNPAQIEAILKQSGSLLLDGKNGVSVPSLNAYEAVGSLMPQPPASVMLEAPTIGIPGVPVGLVARTQPLTSTTPLQYNWQVTGQQPVMHQSGIVDSAIFSWSTTGTHTVTVTVTNVSGEATASTVLDVVPGSGLFFPQLIRNLAP